jgi:hypothetical protein
MLGVFGMIGAIFLILLLRGGNTASRLERNLKRRAFSWRRDALKGPSRLESLEAVR